MTRAPRCSLTLHPIEAQKLSAPMMCPRGPERMPALALRATTRSHRRARACGPWRIRRLSRQRHRVRRSARSDHDGPSTTNFVDCAFGGEEIGIEIHRRMNRRACRYVKGNSLKSDGVCWVTLWSMPPRTGSEPMSKDAVGVSGLSDDEWRKLLDLAGRARAVRSMRSNELLAIFNRNYDQLWAELTHPLARRVYAPLIARIAAGPLTIAQVGQSLDGRIATESGHSHYINGEGGLDHLHRLRALADAVVVGARTVILDNPRLTTRRVPARARCA